MTNINCCSYQFAKIKEARKENYPYYVLIEGHNPGVYDRWTEVLQQLKNYPKHPWFNRFHKLEEALDYARRNLGPNFFITPALRFPVSKVRDSTISFVVFNSEGNSKIFVAMCGCNFIFPSPISNPICS